MTSADLPRRRPELDGRTFLVCVGAAKTATSWLHARLGASPGVVVSPLKEVHFFDARFAPGGAPAADLLALRRLAFHLAQEGDPVANLRARPTFRASLDRAAMILDDDAYFDHFARLCGPDTRTFADITPAYATLGAEGFRRMRAFAASQDVRLRVLFLMRDPVERLWSHMRHMQQLDPALDAARDWEALLARPEVAARSDYAATVGALDAVFQPAELLFLFHEHLFEAPALEALHAFADAGPATAPVGERRNETAVKTPLPTAARTAFRRALAPQYAFCRDRFGAQVPAAWGARPGLRGPSGSTFRAN